MVAKIALAGISAALSVASAMNAYSAAGSQKAAAQAQVANARRQAEVEAATQMSDRAKRFEAAMSSQTAAAASRGIELDSFDAIARGDRDAFDTDKAVINANKGSRLYNLELYGWDAEQSARAKQRQAMMSAGKSLFDFGSAVYRSGVFDRAPPQSYPSRTYDQHGGV